MVASKNASVARSFSSSVPPPSPCGFIAASRMLCSSGRSLVLPLEIPRAHAAKKKCYPPPAALLSSPLQIRTSSREIDGTSLPVVYALGSSTESTMFVDVSKSTAVLAMVSSTGRLPPRPGV